MNGTNPPRGKEEIKQRGERGSGASCREERGRVQVGPGDGLLPKATHFCFLIPSKKKKERKKKRNRIRNRNEADDAGTASLGCTVGPWCPELCVSIPPTPPRALLSSCRMLAL